jgi:hypothetical protein
VSIVKKRKEIEKETLSKEWIDLVEYAMNSGVTKQEFAKFLEEKRKK